MMIRWVTFDIESRLCWLDILLQSWSLSGEQFESLVNDYPFLATMEERLVKNRLRDSPIPKPVCCHLVPVVVPRDTSTSSNKTNEVHYLDTVAKQWRHLTNLPFTNRSMYSVAVYRNCVYICGGEEDQIPTNEVQDFLSIIKCSM